MRKILTSSGFLIPTLIIASVYVIFVTYLMNVSLVSNTIFGSFAITYKLNILLALFQGMWTAMSGSVLILLLLTALLTGANLTLLARQIKALWRVKSLHFVVGGNSLLGIVGSGCTACGLPVLSILGLSGSLIYLPFRGVEISYLAVILLSISFYLLLRSVFEKEYCAMSSNLQGKNI